MISRDAVAVVVVVRRHPERLTKSLLAVLDQVDSSAVVIANLTESELSVPQGVAAVTLSSQSSLSDAVTTAVAERPSEFIWILRDDTVVRPGALTALKAVCDTSPSVGVVGPKQLDADKPGEIREMGESISRSGFAVQLAERELDQGQYDRHSDVLGVGESGMFVRRGLWDELAGFDGALATVDGALDFCYRARAAGWRVEIVPTAVIETSYSSLEAALGDVSENRTAFEEAKARAHRVLAYVVAVVAPVRAISLVAGAFLRSIGRFVRKQAHPFAELFGTVMGALRVGAISASRRSIARTSTQPIDRGRLFVTRMDMARRRAMERDSRRAALEAVDNEPSLGFGQLGAWMTAAAAVVGLVLAFPLWGAEALTGGGLLPLSPSITDVWSMVGATWTPIAGGMASAPDGFNVLIAALASLTWWNPNMAIVGLWLLAVPLSFVAGWVGAGAVTVRSSTALVVATAWTLMPSLHSALAEGRLGSVIAHILIPYAIRALLSHGAVSAGWFALLTAAIWVSVPALAPVIVAGTLLRAAFRRPAILLALVPSLALEWPRILDVATSQPWLYFADRGVPVAAITQPEGAFGFWPVVPNIPFVDGAVASGVVIAFTAVAVAGALVAIIAGNTRLAGIVAVGSVGTVVAFVLGDVPFSHIADHAIGIASGALLDPLWFGLLSGLAVAGSSIRVARTIVVPAVIGVTAVLSASTIALPIVGGGLVAPSAVRSVPAYVEAETRTRPAVGTLIITPRDNAIVAQLQRGGGATLSHWSATASTRTTIGEREKAAATLAGNLIVKSGFDVVGAAKTLNIRFVLLNAAPTHLAVSAIASHSGLTQVGQTTSGVLWIVDMEPAANLEHSGRNWTYVMLAALSMSGALIAAIPTSLPRRRFTEDALDHESGEPDA